jgi:hypothetical protein
MDERGSLEFLPRFEMSLTICRQNCRKAVFSALILIKPEYLINKKRYAQYKKKVDSPFGDEKCVHKSLFTLA